MKNKSSMIVIGVLLAILAIIGIVVGSYWDKFKMFISGEILITQSEADKNAQEKYNLGYENGTKNIATLQLQINNQKETIENNNIELKNLRTQITALQEQGILDSQEIANLENQVAMLEAENAELQNLIDAYENALPVLVGENQAIVKFIVGNELKEIQVIDKNSTIENPYQVSFEQGNVSTFNGWKVNGESVDISTYVVTEHVTFIADITERCQVNYTVNNVEHSSEIVISGSTPNYPIITGYDSYYFLGWFVGDTKVDTTTYVVTENVTLNAVFKQTLTATFIANDTTYSTQTISMNESITKPTDPIQILNGRTSRFNGWKVNGVLVDPSTYIMTDDTTFVADFSKQIIITIHAYTRNTASDSSYEQVVEGSIYGLTNAECLKTITMYEGDTIVYPEITAGSYRDSFFGYAYSSTQSGRNSYLGNVSVVIEGAVIIVGDFSNTINDVSENEYINLGETPVFTSDCNIAVLFRYNP